MHVSTCERAEVSELGALERDVAGVLAILGDSVSLAALHDVVAACGVEASEQELRTSVERLVRAMFIVEVPPRFCEGRSFQMPVRVALGVLRARDAAVAPPRPVPTGQTLPADTPLREAMQVLAQAHGPILLTEDGRVTGMLTDAAAVRALIARRGQEAQETEAGADS